MDYDIFYIFSSGEIIIGSPDNDDTIIVKSTFIQFKEMARDFTQSVPGTHQFYVKVDALTPAISYDVDLQDYEQ